MKVARLMASVFAACLTSVQADAQAKLDDMFAGCRLLSDKAARLDCFDGIPTISIRPSPDASSDDIGGWEFSSTTNKLTDEKRYIVAREGASNRGNLIIKCDKVGKLSLYVHILTPQYLGSISSQSSALELKYRFGKNSAVATKYVASDSSAAILNQDAVRRFLDQARSEQDLIVVATGFDYKSVELEFDMSGAKAAIEKVAKSCRH